MNKYILAIPFYKNENFIEEIINWYSSENSAEDLRLIKEVVIYNDCPMSEDSLYLEDRCNQVGFKYKLNPTNLGYLNTANLAYAFAKDEQLNLILLNSDVVPIPGFLAEINRCFELDSMLGVVSARSNNATICNLYNIIEYYEGQESLNKYLLDHETFKQYVPLISYAPVVTGFCFAIKSKIIQKFNGFDEIYTVGYEEENDFCLKISERGYRIGIANRAFLAHKEGKSFRLTSSRDSFRNENAKIIRNKYKYYDKIIQNHSDSLAFNAEEKIKASLNNSVKYLIDARVLSPCHNGSNKLIIEIIKSLVELDLSIDVLAEPSAIDFHRGSFFDKVNFIHKIEEVYEFGVTLGQPMHHSALHLIPLHSIVSCCIFFDTIAHDCPNLRSENDALDSIWSTLPYIYSDISFISHHSQIQFELKFGSGTANLHTHLIPINLNSNSLVGDDKSSGKVLVFGNKFSHKGIDLLLSELPKNNSLTYHILGRSQSCHGLNVKFLSPGEVDMNELNKLMSSVDYMIMPSFAEGFGFPLLEAVSYGKPIYCREIDCYKEIIWALPENKKHLIRLVPNFSSLGNQVIIEKQLVKSYSSYQEYVNEILNDIKKRDPIVFFNKFKCRVLLLSGNITDKNEFLRVSIYKRIYRKLLSTWMAPLAILLKKTIFKSNLIRKILL